MFKQSSTFTGNSKQINIGTQNNYGVEVLTCSHSRSRSRSPRRNYSQIKVVDKATGKAIFEQTSEFSGNATQTNHFGSLIKKQTNRFTTSDDDESSSYSKTDSSSSSTTSSESEPSSKKRTTNRK